MVGLSASVVVASLWASASASAAAPAPSGPPAATSAPTTAAPTQPAAPPAQPPAAAAPAQPPPGGPPPAQPPPAAKAPAQPPPAQPPPAQPPPAATTPTQPPAQPTQPPAEAAPTPAQPPAQPAEATPTPTPEPTQPAPAEATPTPAEPPTEGAEPPAEDAEPAAEGDEAGETPEGEEGEEFPPISDEAWDAMLDKQVEVTAGEETVTGKLAAVTDDTVVIVLASGEVKTLSKSEATSLKLASVPPPPEESKKADETKKQDEDFPRLGIFTTQGVSFAHWRTDNYRKGAAAYALDLGAGYNFRPTIGLYGVIGGNVAAKLKLRDGTVKGNMGHFSAMVRYKRKYFALLAGLGIAWSRRDEMGPAGKQTQKDVGLAIPIRIMGHIPLPKDFYLGMGIGYTLAVFAKGKLFNGPALQLVLARW